MYAQLYLKLPHLSKQKVFDLEDPDRGYHVTLGVAGTTVKALKVIFEMVLPIGMLTSFGLKAQKKISYFFQPYISKMQGLKLYALLMARFNKGI